MAAVHIDLDSFRDGFGEGVPMPPRLQSFGGWLGQIERGGLGYFDSYSSEPLDDTYVSDDFATARLRERLGIFLHLGEGSRLALWDHGGAAPAVVLIGSEGEQENVASSFDACLIAWARGETGVFDLDENDDGVGANRDELAGWLAAEGVVAADEPEPPSFEEWFNGVVEDAKREREWTPADGRGRRDPAAVAGLAARAEPLLGRLTDDEELIAFCAELGINLGAVPGADEFRDLARFEDGYSLSFAWPWDYPNRLLEERHPPEIRNAMQRAGQRMFLGFSMHAAGDRSLFRAHYGREYAEFPGPLPRGMTFDDTDVSLLERFGPPRYESTNYLTWYDAETDLTLHVDFATSDTDGGVVRGRIQSVLVSVRAGFEP